MAIDILKIVLVSLIPIICAIILMALKLYTGFSKLKKIYQTIIISTVFSITCILGTVLSVQTSTGAAINVRDASPIIAGLIFGGPAGIVAGLVGGLYRFVAAYWDPGLMPTQLACSIATAMAGLLTAFIRKFIFNSHHGKWYYGAFIAILVEDFHMMMVFITNFNNTQLAYEIVTAVIVPMLIANTLSVCVASVAACVMAKEKLFVKPKKLKLTTKVQISLAGLLVAAYALVSGFAFLSVYDNARKNVRHNLETSVTDLRDDVSTSVDAYMLDSVYYVANRINNVVSISPTKTDLDKNLEEEMYEILITESISEINIVCKDNKIHYSTNGYDNPPFDMADPTHQQANEFIILNTGEVDFYIQDIREPSSKEQERIKYAAYVLSPNSYSLGFVQIGLYEKPYHELLDKEVMTCASFRHIDEQGFLAVTDNEGNIVSISYMAPEINKIDIANLPNSTEKAFPVQIGSETVDYYTYHIEAEGYHIVAFANANEMMASAQISLLCITLVQIFAFMMLYCIIYIIVKRVVTDKIDKIGSGLQEISNGNLNVKINERNSIEMDQLSDNINKTVDSLKEYTQKEKEKNEEELRFAKTIQHSVLPTVFPLNEKFEIYASMDTAKAVGGDFYDFFFVDPEHVAIEIADVSGKGVPAALFMMQAKTIIKNLVESGMPINEAYTEANHRLCENNEAEMFVTAWMGVINLTNGHVEYVNAGHNPPLICNENNEFVYINGGAGFVLGGMDGYKYKLQSFDIVPGQKIYLYTDGVTEAMNKKSELFGEEQLLNVINKNRQYDVHTICDEILDAIKKHADGFEQSDDITMLCFGLNGKESTDAIVVDAKIENTQSIIEYVNKLLDMNGCTNSAKMDIDVAIDELFSNICYYAYKPEQSGKAKIVVDFYSENEVAIIFEDRGIPYNPLKKPDPDSKAALEDRQIGGLGIFIVKKTMNSMEYKHVNGHNVLKIKKIIK